MNTRTQMLIAKGEIVTPKVKSCNYNKSTGKWDIVFNGGKKFSYAYNNVSILKNPEILNPALHKIEHMGKELFDIAAIYVFKDSYHAYWHICFSNGSERDYREEDIKIVKSCLSESESKNVFSYLYKTAESVSIKSDDGTNLLSKQYDKIADFVGNDTALALYLNPQKYKNTKSVTSNPIFPFGCNASQYSAVKNALENKLVLFRDLPVLAKHKQY